MENPEINEVCEECLKKTKIRYKYDGSFFTPKLRSIDHLQFGNSKLLHNPIVIILEWLYLQFKHLRNFFRRLSKRMFPRRPKVWCNHIDSQLTGQINYADRDYLNVPIHNLKVEMWGRTRWLQWRKLSEGYSDYEGKFSIPFELREARNWKIHRVQFEVYQTTHVYFHSEKSKLHLEQCYTERVPISNLIGMRYSIGTIHLHLWEYRKDTIIPRTEIINPDNNSPQYYSQGRLDAMYEQIIPLELIKVKHLAQIKEAPETITLAEIQRDYPENLTTCIEKKLPGYTRSDEWFGMRMMNGMNGGSFLPDKQNPNHYWIKYFGVCNYDHNELYALPTVEIKFKLKENGLPTPIEIDITGQTNIFDKDPWQKKIFTPESGDDWLYAKRVARVNGAFSTEVDEHFSGTHINTEQYAIAAYRNFRKSPLANLLFPHLKEVALINNAADSLLIHGYIPSATALTEDGLHARVADILGMQDWKNWVPEKPMSEAHTCVRAENLFWDLVVKYIDIFFEEHLEEIKNHWHEVYLFSKDLTEHSVPVFNSKLNWENLSPNEKKLAEDRFEYYAFLYSFDKDAKRETINGELKTVSRITKSKSFEHATPEDLENLKHACRYMIMIATYIHTWINEHQYDDLGEVLYSSGGLRFGDKERGILAPESDLSISPDLTVSTGMLWFTNFLSRTEYGFITRNEEGDVNPLFSKMLLDKKEEFAKLGVDVHAIESRTNI